MPKPSITDKIYSNDYLDFIFPYQSSTAVFLEEYGRFEPFILDGGYALFQIPASDISGNLVSYIGYSSIPKLYTLLDTTSLEASGILQAQNQTLLNLDGNGVLIGFIDTGIDYTHEAFRNSDGSTRILGIWDQTIREGTPPELLRYGQTYTSEDLNRALASEHPLEIVPSTDTNGHGTFLAGVAAGTPDAGGEFIGAAPKSKIAMVKLKQAKTYLRDFYFIPEDTECYQESDIIMGIVYLTRLSQEVNLPLILCIGIGSNQGDHAGNDALSVILSNFVSDVGNYCVIAGGNEAGKAHHYYGTVSRQGEVRDVEVLVGEDNPGFSIELWARAPELYSISITSPLGETIDNIPARIGPGSIFRFLLERTVLTVDYVIVEHYSGSELILLRFANPTPGIWKIHVKNETFINGSFHMWLPVTGFSRPGTVFLAPNPDTTLTTPSAALMPVTVSTYNAYDGSLFINSSRGFTRIGALKPDIASPGVNVYGPVLGGRYSFRSGSSIAAAMTAGAMALLVNWGLSIRLPHLLTNAEMKNYLIRGAIRSPVRPYPNKEWGYGTLNIYHIFESLI